MEECVLFFKCYQTFIVGVLGFSGVIITLYMNSKISRDQHKRQIKHERDSVRTAIYSELVIIRKIFQDMCEMVEVSGGVESAFFPNNISNIVYTNFINKIGLLSKNEIESIIEAYSLISDVPLRLNFLSEDHDPSFDKPGYIYISEKYSKSAIGVYKSFLPKIEKALKELSKQLND